MRRAAVALLLLVACSNAVEPDSDACAFRNVTHTTDGQVVAIDAWYHGPICDELMRDYPNQTRMVP